MTYDPYSHPLALRPKLMVDEDGDTYEGYEEGEYNSWSHAAFLLEIFMHPLSAIHNQGGLNMVYRTIECVVPLADPNVDLEKLFKRCNEEDDGLKELHRLLAEGLNKCESWQF